MTVAELIEILNKYPSDAPVAGTWESVIKSIEVYQSADGVVLIDADDGFYKESFISGGRTAAEWIE